jgi:hypothetical protein
MTTISIKITEDRLKYLKKMSHYLSIERDTDLTLSELVREALDQSFPMPKQNDENKND